MSLLAIGDDIFLFLFVTEYIKILTNNGKNLLVAFYIKNFRSTSIYEVYEVYTIQEITFFHGKECRRYVEQ